MSVDKASYALSQGDCIFPMASLVPLSEVLGFPLPFNLTLSILASLLSLGRCPSSVVLGLWLFLSSVRL